MGVQANPLWIRHWYFKAVIQNVSFEYPNSEIIMKTVIQVMFFIHFKLRVNMVNAVSLYMTSSNSLSNLVFVKKILGIFLGLYMGLRPYV